MTKNELLSFIAFKNEQEKEEAEFYMAVKGVELHRRILLFLGCSFSEKSKIKWSKIVRIIFSKVFGLMDQDRGKRTRLKQIFCLARSYLIFLKI